MEDFMDSNSSRQVALNKPRSTSAVLRALLEGLSVAYIIVMLSGYAFIKIVQSQFANRTDPYKAAMRVGELPSVELLWALYARAPMYETMLGLIEALCVLLIFFRRTRPVGALLTLASMVNVAAMNLAFGIGATFNAVTLAVAAVVLCILYYPVYRQWLSTAHTSHISFGRNWDRAALALKTLLIIGAVTSTGGIWLNLIRPLAAMRGDLYGSWRVESIEGTAPGQNGVAPLGPGQVIMLNKMNVLAVRSGDDFRFGRYEENDEQRTLDLSLYPITAEQLDELPPPGKLAERRKALDGHPVGYSVHGTIERPAVDRAIARFRASDSSVFVTHLRRE